MTRPAMDIKRGEGMRNHTLNHGVKQIMHASGGQGGSLQGQRDRLADRCLDGGRMHMEQGSGLLWAW